ncbi:MAG: hypothetical protein EKK46_08285 [Rhodocyclaceae bacterium]|nr:MAG: hypothetical protein EKK46_08285 [Rhodocyclaceae bacterium]
MSVSTPLPPRLILYHKQSTSGRLRYLRLPTGILAFEPMPTLSSLKEEGTASAKVLPHPAACIRAAESHLKLPNGSLEAEAEFYAEIDTPEGVVPVLLGRFTTIDPPFAEAETLGGKFITLTEARGLHPIELDLARRAYELVLG